MTTAPTDIWQFEQRLTHRLWLWGGMSTLVGALLALFGSSFWRGWGLQSLGWGAIDALLAFLGARRVQARSAEPAAHDPQVQAREARRARGILLFNAGLDVGYVAGGLALAHTKGRDDPFWRGSGYGIVLQGAFLLFLDLAHALLVPQRDPGR